MNELELSPSKSKNRLDYIDVCKALGIILVILGHTYNIPHHLYNIIYSFHMPLFFILSGYTFNRDKNINMSFGEFISKKSKQYLIPYFIFCIANLGIQIAWALVFSSHDITLDYLITNVKGILLCYSNMANMPNCSPLWFLVCLFFSDILFWIIIKLKEKYAFIPAFLCAAIYYILIPFCKDFTSFPFKFPTFLIATFFLYIGYITKKIMTNKVFSKKNVPLIAIIPALIGCLCIIILTENKVGMNENFYSNYFIFIATSIIMSVSVIYLSYRCAFLQTKSILWLGKNTIYIVAFNFICRDVGTTLYYYIPIINRVRIHLSVSFFLTTAVCIFCIFICIHIKNLILKSQKCIKKASHV